MQCEHCQTLINPEAAWKGADRFYCSEFCADTEVSVPTPPVRSVYKDQIDHQYLERLARLLPHARRWSRRQDVEKLDPTPAVGRIAA